MIVIKYFGGKMKVFQNVKVHSKIIAVCIAMIGVIVVMSSCATIKGAVGDTIGMQTLSLEEVIEKSNEVPCEYDKDLYYKGLKIGIIEPWSVVKNVLSPLEAQKVWDHYMVLLKNNNAWDDRTVDYQTVTYDKKARKTKIVRSKASTQIDYLTKAFSIDGKHQVTIIMYEVPVGKERQKDGSDVVSYDDVYYVFDEVKTKISVPVHKQTDMVPYIQEFRDIMKTILDKDPERFPADKPKA
jgi:hypothetical protein